MISIQAIDKGEIREGAKKSHLTPVGGKVVLIHCMERLYLGKLPAHGPEE